MTAKNDPEEFNQNDDEEFVLDDLGYAAGFDPKAKAEGAGSSDAEDAEDDADGGDFFDELDADFDEVILDDSDDDDFAIDIDSGEAVSSGTGGDEQDALFPNDTFPPPPVEGFGEPVEFKEFGGEDWGGSDLDMSELDSLTPVVDDEFTFDKAFASDSEDAFAEPEDIELVDEAAESDASFAAPGLEDSDGLGVDPVSTESLGADPAEAPVHSFAEGDDDDFARELDDLNGSDTGSSDTGNGPAEPEQPGPLDAESGVEAFAAELSAELEGVEDDFDLGVDAVSEPQGSDPHQEVDQPEFDQPEVDQPEVDQREAIGSIDEFAAHAEAGEALPSQGDGQEFIAEEEDDWAPADPIGELPADIPGAPAGEESDQPAEAAASFDGSKFQDLTFDENNADVAEPAAADFLAEPFDAAGFEDTEFGEELEAIEAGGDEGFPADGESIEDAFQGGALIIDDQLSEDALEEVAATGEPMDPADAGIDLSALLPGQPMLEGEGWEDIPLGNAADDAAEPVDEEWAPVSAEMGFDNDEAFAGAGATEGDDVDPIYGEGAAEDDPIYGAAASGVDADLGVREEPDFSDYEDEYVDAAGPAAAGVAVLAPRKRRALAWVGTLAALLLVGFAGVLLARPDLLGLATHETTEVDRVALARPNVDLGIAPPEVLVADAGTVGDPVTPVVKDPNVGTTDPVAVTDPITDPTTDPVAVTDPITDPTTDPVAVTDPITDPTTDPVAVTDPITDPTTDPVAVTDPITDPTTDPVAVTDPITDPTTDPVAVTDPITDPTTDPVAVTDPTTDPTTDPVAVTDPITDPTTDPVAVTDPITDPTTDPVAVTDPITDPTTDPVAVTDPITDPTTDPVAVTDPITDPTTDPVAVTDPITDPTTDPVAVTDPITDPTTDPVAVTDPATDPTIDPALVAQGGDPKEGGSRYPIEEGAQALGSDAVIVPFRGDRADRFQGVDLRLINGSKAFAQLHNGNYFIGTVKSAKATYVTLTVDEGEVSLHRDDLITLTPLASADYQELKKAQNGFVRLSNSNRLRGTVLEAVQGDHVILETRANRILIPRSEIEEIGAENEAPVKFDDTENDAWLLRMIEEEMRRQEQQPVEETGRKKPRIVVPVGEPALPGK